MKRAYKKRKFSKPRKSPLYSNFIKNKTGLKAGAPAVAIQGSSRSNNRTHVGLLRDNTNNIKPNYNNTNKGKFGYSNLTPEQLQQKIMSMRSNRSHK